MKLHDFWQKLEAMYMRGPDKAAKAEYYGRLLGWGLKAKQLDTLFEYLTEKHTYYPALAEISNAVKELGFIDAPRTKAAHFTSFTLNGVDYYQKCHDPGNPPLPPKEATNLEIHVDRPDNRSYRPATPVEAQETFRRGWIESGADPGKCPAVMSLAEVLP